MSVNRQFKNMQTVADIIPFSKESLVETPKGYGNFEAHDLQVPRNTYVTDERWP